MIYRHHKVGKNKADTLLTTILINIRILTASE